MDEDFFLNALENETNASIVELTTSKIKSHKNNILQKLQLPRLKLKSFHKKLKDYRYCSDLKDIQYGHYIRWISLKNPDSIYITNGGLLCDIQIINNELHVRCKNNMNMLFQIKLSEVILFQKLTNQEKIILKAMKYLE